MKTILVVDDSQIMRNIVKNTFSELKIPCQYLEAADGKTAFQLLETNKVNLVFLDWNMPEMDGIDFLKKARSMPDYENLPIVMITSEAARYNLVDALHFGATDYIVKPIDEKIFSKIVSKLVF